jgi:hypothetical protein
MDHRSSGPNHDHEVGALFGLGRLYPFLELTGADLHLGYLFLVHLHHQHLGVEHADQYPRDDHPLHAGDGVLPYLEKRRRDCCQGVGYQDDVLLDQAEGAESGAESSGKA